MNWPAPLGIAQSLHRAGRLTEAEEKYREAVLAAPETFAPYYFFGLLRLHQGRFGEAEPLFVSALQYNPASPEARFYHALTLMRVGRLEEALATLDRLLIMLPNAVGALNNRGEILAALGRSAEALKDFDGALAVRPNFVPAVNGRGYVLLAMWRFEEALASFDHALAVEPDLAEALLGRGKALTHMNRAGEAVPAYDQALSLMPDYSEVWFQRGIALDNLGYFEDAIHSYERAIMFHPRSLGARNNRCVVLQKLRRFGEAAKGYREILSLIPNDPRALNGLANCAMHTCDWSQNEELLKQIRIQILQGGEIQLGTLMGYASDPSLQLACAKNYLKEKLPPSGKPLWRGKPFSSDKIKLAYCSANFNSHPMPRLLAGMFEAHDRSRFEVTAISFGLDDGSEMRKRLVKAFDRFHDVPAKSDKDVALLVADLGVDIAIDLMGFTAGARTAIFAYRPAPVQVNYMGFPCTLGTEYYDYIIGDQIVLPTEQQLFYSEKIVQLPDSYLVNDDKRPFAPAPPMRTEVGLPERGFVFCCFNNNWKITAPLFDIWMRLLQAIPGSVLWLLEDNREAADNLRRNAALRSITSERLIFAPRVTQEAHLARHQLADLFLDTLPYNAHTTASDSLWVGVPLITMLGETFHSRVAASALHAMGVPDLATKTLADYESLALNLAHNPARITGLRRKLKENRATAALFNTPRLTRNIESAFETMGEIFQQGKTPCGFRVRM